MRGLMAITVPVSSISTSQGREVTLYFLHTSSLRSLAVPLMNTPSESVHKISFHRTLSVFTATEITSKPEALLYMLFLYRSAMLLSRRLLVLEAWSLPQKCTIMRRFWWGKAKLRLLLSFMLRAKGGALSPGFKDRESCCENKLLEITKKSSAILYMARARVFQGRPAMPRPSGFYQ